jgi:hypothetical protein
MKPKDLLIPVIAVILVGSLVALSIKGNRAPALPSTPQHIEAASGAPATCLGCHGKNGQFPRTVGHPPKDQCPQCHTFKELKK